MLKVCIYSVLLMIGSVISCSLQANDLSQVRTCNHNNTCVSAVMKLEGDREIHKADRLRLRGAMGNNNFNLTEETVLNCRQSHRANNNVCQKKNLCFAVRITNAPNHSSCTNNTRRPINLSGCSSISQKDLERMRRAAKLVGWEFIPHNMQSCV